MSPEKFCYQILIKLKNDNILSFWVRNEKISYETEEDLINYIKENFSEIKKYHNIQKLIVKEVPMSNLNELNAWYRNNSRSRDYTVITDK